MLFVVEGRVTLSIDGARHELTVLTEGGYAYLPPGSRWTLHNTASEPARFHWIRKRYERVDGLDAPPPLVLNERDVEPVVQHIGRGACRDEDRDHEKIEADRPRLHETTAEDHSSERRQVLRPLLGTQQAEPGGKTAHDSRRRSARRPSRTARRCGEPIASLRSRLRFSRNHS